jgi:hypothetical protein
LGFGGEGLDGEKGARGFDLLGGFFELDHDGEHAQGGTDDEDWNEDFEKAIH